MERKKERKNFLLFGLSAVIIISALWLFRPAQAYRVGVGDTFVRNNIEYEIIHTEDDPDPYLVKKPDGEPLAELEGNLVAVKRSLSDDFVDLGKNVEYDGMFTVARIDKSAFKNKKVRIRNGDEVFAMLTYIDDEAFAGADIQIDDNIMNSDGSKVLSFIDIRNRFYIGKRAFAGAKGFSAVFFKNISYPYSSSDVYIDKKDKNLLYCSDEECQRYRNDDNSYLWVSDASIGYKGYQVVMPVAEAEKAFDEDVKILLPQGNSDGKIEDLDLEFESFSDYYGYKNVIEYVNSANLYYCGVEPEELDPNGFDSYSYGDCINANIYKNRQYFQDKNENLNQWRNSLRGGILQAPYPGFRNYTIDNKELFEYLYSDSSKILFKSESAYVEYKPETRLVEDYYIFPVEVNPLNKYRFELDRYVNKKSDGDRLFTDRLIEYYSPGSRVNVFRPIEAEIVNYLSCEDYSNKKIVPADGYIEFPNNAVNCNVSYSYKDSNFVGTDPVKPDSDFPPGIEDGDELPVSTDSEDGDNDSDLDQEYHTDGKDPDNGDSVVDENNPNEDNSEIDGTGANDNSTSSPDKETENDNYDQSSNLANENSKKLATENQSSRQTKANHSNEKANLKNQEKIGPPNTAFHQLFLQNPFLIFLIGAFLLLLVFKIKKKQQ